MVKKLIHITVIILLLTAVSVAAPIDHQVEQPRPVMLGTSGGNINNSSAQYCCSGTLGSLVDDGSIQYILSNNHILARTNMAAIGEQITQPGLIDQQPVCFEDTADMVAILSDFVKIRFYKKKIIPLNKVDAAIAQVIPGAVEPNGAILEIGTVGSETAAASIDQAVKKSGRTSGLTHGRVTAVNVTVDVGYSSQCGSTSGPVARFVNQIFVQGANIGKGGDSGSLFVEDVNSSPRAVGLLFAGNSIGSLAVANPIDSVLNAFGVTMPGGSVQVPTGSITGTVENAADASPIEAATVTTNTGQTAVTDADGIYLLNDVPVGQLSVKASADGFRPQNKRAVVKEDQQATVDFALRVKKGKALDHASPNAAFNRALKAKNVNENKMFAVKDVVGTGIGKKEGKPVIQIYLKEDSEQARSQIPAELDGVPVEVIVTGAFEAI